MKKNRQKLSNFETKTLSELKEMQPPAYIPLFTENRINNKINIDTIGESLTEGTNINIDENTNEITAIDTEYTAGEKISINNNEIKYTGEIPKAYSASEGLKLSSNRLYSSTKGALGSKLNPVTFDLDNNDVPKLIAAGNTIDSIRVTKKSQGTSLINKYFLINSKNYIASHDASNPSDIIDPAYFLQNTETGKFKWSHPETEEGHISVKPTDYSHVALHNEEMKYLIVTTSFMKALSNKEVIINITNRTDLFIELWFYNDLDTKFTFATYEQGLMQISNEIPGNSGVSSILKVVYYIDTDPYNNPHSEFLPSNAQEPPFCGNVNSAAAMQPNRQRYLYSTIRFIPIVNENLKTIAIVSTVY